MDAYQLYYLVQQAREHTCLDAAMPLHIDFLMGYLVETDLYPLQRQLMCSSWIDILIHNQWRRNHRGSGGWCPRKNYR